MTNPREYLADNLARISNCICMRSTRLRIKLDIEPIEEELKELLEKVKDALPEVLI